MGSAAEEHAARIRALDAQAAARRDFDGMMAIYAPEAQEVLPGTPPVIGREVWRRLEADWRLMINISNGDQPPA
jgi:ketosteroid isomerase-like protein